MNDALRNIGGMLAGLFVALALTSTLEVVSGLVYPLPEGLDVHDRQALQAHIATLPPGAFGLVLAGYFLGTLAGTALAARLNRGRQRAPGVAVGCLLLAAALANLLSMPHPGWFLLACLVVFPAATALGVSLAGRANSRAAGEPPIESPSQPDE